MKKNLVCTLLIMAIGAGFIFCGNGIKASAVTTETPISASESKEFSSNKQAYLDKLDAIQEGLSDLEPYYAGSTLQMRYAANEEYKRWDKALNEIYGDLKNILSPEDMALLQKDEIEWINFKEAEARKAADVYKGGTAAPLAYVSSLAETTKDRCYELVYRYM